MRIFVAGATGVIGRRVVPALVSAGHQVTGIGRTPEKRAALEQAGAAAVEVSIFDPAALRRAVAGHDVVVNVATHIPPGMRIFFRWAWRTNDRIRRQGAANLADAAIADGARRFVQESFAPVYPDRGDAWIDETTPIAPVRYNRTVADAEAAAERFSASGRTGIILRFGGFYGPDASHVRDLIRYVRKGWGPLPGPPDAFMSSVSHDDAASAVVALATGDAPAGTYNVVDDEPVTHRAYFDALAAALGAPPPKLPPKIVTHLMGSLGEMLARSLRISNRKLRETCGWAPRFPGVRDGWPAVVAALPKE
ncbi:MAG TPA: NAD(P)-dependent oxidoreductase [Tepidisphaeraceae bacterium]|jgi:nucleoside-diphosphate-sugar epimerase